MSTLFEWQPDEPVAQPEETESETLRLGRQNAAVYEAMQSGLWWTLAGLKMHLGFHGIMISETGVSARIRDMRKPPINATVVRRTRPGSNVREYRMVPR